MSTCVHTRFSWGYLVPIISSFFAAMYLFSLSLSSPVSVSLDFLLMIVLSIYSNVYCHSHFIPPPPPFLSFSVSTLDCLYLITLSFIFDVYCHSHFTLLFLSFSVSTLDCLFLITLLIVSDVYCHSHFTPPPHFCLCTCHLWIVYS